LSYQAGILLALEEAGLEFQYLDGTSGGSLNMSMLLSGLNPAEICRRWRTLNLKDTIAFLPLKDYLKVENLEGLGDAKGFRNKVLPHFGIDTARIRAVDSPPAGYNVLDYANKAVKVISHRDIDEDMIIAGMSLPGVFPPVRKDGGVYLDTGFVQDANLMEAVKNGAEELWVLWGLGNTGTYRGGALHLYVQMLEMSANAALNNQLEAIHVINRRIENGDSPYGQTRAIRVHVVKPEYPLPLDPDLYLGKIDHATLIEMGYADGKSYLRAMPGTTAEARNNPSRMKDPAPGIRFRKCFQGHVSLAQRPESKQDLKIELCIHIADLEAFLADPEHAARITGHLSCPAFGPLVLLDDSRFFMASLPNRTRRIGYELRFDSGNRRYRLNAEQILHDDPGPDMWRDLSTLSVQLLATEPDAPADVRPLGTGMLHSSMGGIKDWLGGIRATETQTVTDGLKVVARFAKFVLRELYDVYG
jgi:predicted acylesterase/phospholipase RssA